MRTILVVEDDKKLAHETAKHLEHSGYEVVVATGSTSALDILDSDRRIDVLLTGIAMPNGQPNGLSLAQMAAMRRPGIRMAFIRGFRDIAIDDLLGAVFSKPIDLALLTTTIGSFFLAAEISA